MNDDDYRGHREPMARNLTRKQRRVSSRGPSRPGGITAECGCRYVRTGGAWRHVTPCGGHELRTVADDHEMTTLIGAGT